MKNRVGDYIPGNKVQFLVWLKNFVKKAIANVNHYGINEEEIKALQDLADLYDVDITDELELLTKKLAQFKKTATDRAKVEKLCRGIAQKVKNDSQYTPKIGRDFGIIGEENPFDQKTYKPNIELRRVSSGVEISFTKSLTEGVNIYRRKGGEEKFEFMAYDIHSPYIDTKDMDMDVHCVYEYTAWAVIDGKQIGIRSEIEEITV